MRFSLLYSLAVRTAKTEKKNMDTRGTTVIFWGYMNPILRTTALQNQPVNKPGCFTDLP